MAPLTSVQFNILCDVKFISIWPKITQHQFHKRMSFLANLSVFAALIPSPKAARHIDYSKDGTWNVV